MVPAPSRPLTLALSCASVLLASCQSKPREADRPSPTPAPAASPSTEPAPPATPELAKAPELAKGPPTAWRHSFPSAPKFVRIQPDGSVLAQYEDKEFRNQLMRFRQGRESWRVDGHGDVRAMVGDTLLLGAGRQIVVIDASDGLERFAAILPMPDSTLETSGPAKLIMDPDDPDSSHYEPPWPGDDPWEMTHVRVFSQELNPVLAIDSRNRCWRIDINACEANRDDCIVREGTLPDGNLYDPLSRKDDDHDLDAVFELPNRSRVLLQTARLRVFNPRWAIESDIRARDFIRTAQPFEATVIAVVDDEVMALDPTSCSADHPVVLSDGQRLDDCPDCRPAPASCVRWRQHVADVTPEPFAIVAGPLAIINSDSEGTVAVGHGKIHWQQRLFGDGRTVALGDALYVVGMGDHEFAVELSLSRLTHAGEVTWTTALGIRKSHGGYSTDDIHLGVVPGWALVGLEENIEILEL